MNAGVLQSRLYCIACLLLIGLSPILSNSVTLNELFILALLVVALGVPHGAFDTIYAEHLLRLNSLLKWTGFLAAYIVLAAGVIVLWHISHIAFLIGFLVISTLHFSGDLDDPVSGYLRLMYGGSVVVLPALLHAGVVERLFAQLAGDNAAVAVTAALHRVAPLWMVGTFLWAALTARRNRRAAIETCCLAGSAIVAPPLFAFALFFCFMHSARHILRTISYAGQATTPNLVLSAVLPMIGTVLMAAVAWYLLRNVVIGSRVSQLLFGGLAALTVPHMILVEPVRLSGWQRGSAAGGGLDTPTFGDV